MYEPRTYRVRSGAGDLVSFSVCVGESDLHIQAELDLAEQALAAVSRAYEIVSAHARANEHFLTSLRPLKPPAETVPPVSAMYNAARKAGVGPMAAVAGAIADYVGRRLLEFSGQVIVENGGDIFISTRRRRVIAVHAGSSPLSERIGVIIPGGECVGVCTSSGKVGHSLSMGCADAVVAIADDAAVADAAATALGNRVTEPAAVGAALQQAQHIEELRGVLIVCGEQLGVWGDFEICPLQ